MYFRANLYFIRCKFGDRWKYFVSNCIRSTLPGGELSGFCFFLYSVKGSAACRRVDGKSEVEHLTNHSISLLAIRRVSSHNCICVGLESLSS